MLGLKLTHVNKRVIGKKIKHPEPNFEVWITKVMLQERWDSWYLKLSAFQLFVQHAI